jgi:tRNA (guanosine-2'-O-)-methyltransferase
MKTIEEQVNYLKEFVVEEKNALFARLIEERTDYVAIVMEDLYQSHNQSAVMRSADCYGIQNVHLIENRNRYDSTSSVSQGAREWLTLHRHKKLENNTLETITKLRDEGYRIIATTPHTHDVMIDDLDLGKGKMAFFLGTELTGLSDTVIQEADEFVKVPMYGFTESLNVSVCAAIIMYSVMQRLRKSDLDWHLTAERKNEVLFQWYKNAIKASDAILKRFNSCSEF